MVVGGIVMALGIIITIFGYDKYQSIVGAFRDYEDGGKIIAFAYDESAPPGVIEAMIGILIAVIGMLIAIHGFGQMEGNRKLQEPK